MVYESRLRLHKYLKTGCNDFISKKIASYPISIFTEKDIFDYKKEFNLNFCSLYDKGLSRTGCMMCGYGCARETGCFNRYDVLYNLHHKAYNTFMNYTNKGYTYRYALEYVGVNIPDGCGRQTKLFDINDIEINNNNDKKSKNERSNKFKKHY